MASGSHVTTRRAVIIERTKKPVILNSRMNFHRSLTKKHSPSQHYLFAFLGYVDLDGHCPGFPALATHLRGQSLLAELPQEVKGLLSGLLVTNAKADVGQVEISLQVTAGWQPSPVLWEKQFPLHNGARDI
jgi:hypothetical protein